MSLFDEQKSQGYLIVKMPMELSRATAKEMEFVSTSWVSDEYEAVLFDFENCQKMSSLIIPSIAKLKLALKKIGVEFYSIHVSSELVNLMSREGVESIFSIQPNLRSLDLARGKKKNILLPEYLKVLFEQIVPTCKAGLNCSPVIGQPFLKNGTGFTGLGVLAILSLYEADLFGVVRFYFPAEFLLAMQEKIQSGPREMAISQKSLDLVDGFSWDVFDRIRIGFAGLGIKIQNSMPNILLGVPSQLVPVAKEVTMVYPIKTTFGSFWVEVVRA